MLATSEQTITAPVRLRLKPRIRLATNQTIVPTKARFTQASPSPTALSRLICAFARLKKMTIGSAP